MESYESIIENVGIKRSMTCNQKTILEYLNKQSNKAASIRQIRYGMDYECRQVFYWSTVERVLHAMLRNGKVYRRGEYYIVQQKETKP